MTTSAVSLKKDLYVPQVSTLTVLRKEEKNPVIQESMVRDEYIWQQFLATNRIIHLMRPDFFMIYKFSKSTVLFQQNINLDLGITEVRHDDIRKFMVPQDWQHQQTIDRVLCQIVRERQLQPLDYIYKICCHVECPNTAVKRLMRTSFLIHTEDSGAPNLAFICYHDVSKLITAFNPSSFDINFESGKDYLNQELNRRLAMELPEKPIITLREKEILQFIHQGMSSKEISGHLFISKNTVDTHRQNMLRKWDLPNSTSLLKFAQNEGWI